LIVLTCPNLTEHGEGVFSTSGGESVHGDSLPLPTITANGRSARQSGRRHRYFPIVVDRYGHRMPTFVRPTW
jgi:hypothetical protein